MRQGVPRRGCQKLLVPMPMLRGKGLGLEIVLSGGDFDAELAQLEARLGAQANFYRGSNATVAFDGAFPTDEQFQRLQSLLNDAGINACGLCGGGEVEELARAYSLEFKLRTEPDLSASARSLVADFAGARAEIAARRKRGESSVRHAEVKEPQLRLVESVTTLYHTGTLRGGQALHHVGNLVVVGDVNPGAELVATGDILVFGRLSGAAHAGAQGDERARVYAVALSPVQLRIASFVAADDASENRTLRPEVAFVRESHIVVAALERFDLETLEASS
jgi:septum site-determining protein MinC